ncbi:TPA: hypothetical protein DIU27_05380 [Candidatus Collierbacteria bacterium]|uniref:Uncharacterized protein n=1 Tax=Candidatus Collierbacteria bacterium GW2011_GWB2_44_22 TaxID=1618387 RepID=A0A0G1HY79_9BACT|nr:MAG: hypothetical protein UW31_C0002G0046 [Candidatus Collierbacteria bacterium GW2011_GWA2_44_13]KKT51905.1 MAG: hypothetical protein UW44_C0006G0023 [Candidatus Collierbacteria bacterium GW2011_GWB2_44_22]KKT61883.1 MAG: hypothetical protein UW56_C0016G0017 [Candidatus Collierbacteria bacterium GW2011_GWD1_44_27]KKT66171.1 MAG: hypothetical protein UW58_C0012G0013 [Candidatus Collierbacteria bacterium GW2011_GWC2_44_30]KKT68833.1 MAG: hypothetical protein UW64_C0009G0045 [Microgenomates gr
MRNLNLKQWHANAIMVAIGLIALILVMIFIPAVSVALRHVYAFFAVIAVWVYKWIIVNILKLILWVIMQIGVCFAAPLFIGAGLRWLTTILDKKAEEGKKTHWLGHVIFAVCIGILLGTLWTGLVMWMATLPTWFGGLFQSLGWSGSWGDNPPIAWGIIAFILMEVGYALNVPSEPSRRY